jgi:glycogen debranching enzyme
VWTGAEATLLFVTVLAEAVRWGLPLDEAEPLLPAAGRCLGWLRTVTGADGLVRAPGPGGSPPFARAEIQAMAHRAAQQGADLLDAFGRPGAGRWREWADALRKRFADRFWIDDARGPGPRPAVALAPDGAPVDVPSSAFAHLLDTGLLAGGRIGDGLLDPVRAEQLAALLTGPELDSGWGLRSLGARSPRFAPLVHRGGAVLAADTALAVAGLCAHGFGARAEVLIEGHLAAAAHFESRLPEMYGGERREPGSAPLPHPRACRPEATAAASAVQLLTAPAGLRPDAPAGRIGLRPAGVPGPLGEVRLSGLEVSGGPLAVRITSAGLGLVEEAPEGVRLARE